MQCCVRRKLARRVLRALRQEANSLQRYKEVSYKLENKVVELIQTQTVKDHLIKSLDEDKGKLEQQVTFWQEKFKAEKELRLHVEASLAETVAERETQEEAFEEERKALSADAHSKVAGVKKSLATLQTTLDQSQETVSKLEAENKRLQAKIEESAFSLFLSLFSQGESD